MSTDRQIDKMWYTNTRQYCSAIKRNEILIQATTWMNPVNVMLCEISQVLKDKYMTPLT